ncbi:Uncharacterized protein dnl_04000 [Desulfonema limicola]|uniref:Uncharacterized protein n=1 Tax=Desulfonema limicola TaxID=45656 RepID=A0A975B3N1_9BACT|nr:Uncharacterized protein dnl_04000 [Desulfonema limicola]
MSLNSLIFLFFSMFKVNMFFPEILQNNCICEAKIILKS